MTINSFSATAVCTALNFSLKIQWNQMCSDDNVILQSNTQTDTITGIKEPKMYRVLMHNDHYTTMDFVVDVLVNVFQKPAAEATRIMLDIHKKGIGICGIFTYDIAVSKISRVHELARKNSFPLRCSCEEV